jgi:selenium metabolism protein YedF
MSNRIVDARGKLCPAPLIMTKKALNDIAVGESLDVLIDNDTSFANVERFLRDNGMEPVHTVAGGVYTVSVTKKATRLARPDAASYCVPSPAAHVVCIKNDKMGLGDDELGTVLIKAFVNSLPEVSPQPAAMVFYNAGVHLTTEGSPVLDSLRELETKGVKILSCGTCLDFYKKKTALKVGIITNMYTISETLARAGHVVYP